MLKYVYRFLRDREAFTFVEIILVLLLMSIIGLMVAPRINLFMSDQQKNLSLIAGIAGKTYDDSFLHNRTNILSIHLDQPDPEKEETLEEFTPNSVQVLTLDSGVLKKHPSKSLKKIEFSSDFRMVKVLLPSGAEITNGVVSITYYPQGYSKDLIMHISSNDLPWSFRQYRHLRDPDIIKEHITFE